LLTVGVEPCTHTDSDTCRANAAASMPCWPPFSAVCARYAHRVADSLNTYTPRAKDKSALRWRPHVNDPSFIVWNTVFFWHPAEPAVQSSHRSPGAARRHACCVQRCHGYGRTDTRPRAFPVLSTRVSTISPVHRHHAACLCIHPIRRCYSVSFMRAQGVPTHNTGIGLGTKGILIYFHPKVPAAFAARQHLSNAHAVFVCLASWFARTSCSFCSAEQAEQATGWPRTRPRWRWGARPSGEGSAPTLCTSR
jgi:hypothetical protein